MFAWLLLTLLALVSSQAVCSSGDSTTDLTARLFYDYETIQRDADIPTRTFSAEAQAIATKEDYDAYLQVYFAAHVELTAAQQAEIVAEAETRMAALETAFRAQNVLTRATTLICISAKAIIFGTTLETIRVAVAGYLEAYFTAFTGYQVAVKAYFDGWVAVVEGNNAATIVAQDLARFTLTLTQATKDIQFFVANSEQTVRAEIVAASDLTDAWLQAEVAADATLAAKRAAAKAQIAVVIEAQINLRRANELAVVYNAYLTAKKAELEAAVDEIQNNINRAWAEARAELIAAFQDAATKIDEWRRELAVRLEGIRCETGAVTINAVATDGEASGSVRVEFRGLVCYSDRAEAEVKDIVCASLRTYVLVEGAAIRADAYACNVVAKKRSLEQGGTSVDADVVGTDPGTTPPPDASNSVSVVACFLLVLLSVLFHF